jgi:hypothetical protein
VTASGTNLLAAVEVMCPAEDRPPRCETNALTQAQSQAIGPITVVQPFSTLLLNEPHIEQTRIT